MAAFLLTWNPDRYGNWDDLAWIMRYHSSRWSCGARKTMPKGSRVFLFKQGSEPRGLVADGYVTSKKPFPDKHWDPIRRKKGKKANYIFVKFGSVLGPEPSDFLPFAELRASKLRAINWRTQMSGIEIPPNLVAELERVWTRFTKTGPQARRFARSLKAVEGTLTEVKYYVRKRDRGLVQRAKAESDGNCAACRRNFRALLEGLGLRALQVHHRKQLASSDKPRLTGPKDLAVVCANCHAMIHANSKRAIPVEKLKRRLQRAGYSP